MEGEIGRGRWVILFAAFAILLLPVSVRALDQLMALQGVVRSSGSTLAAANVTNLTIWNAATAGALLYNDSFNISAGGGATAIVNSYLDILIGNGTNGVNLSLEYGRLYYLDVEIEGTDIDFGIRERLPLYSTVGKNLTFMEKITFALDQILEHLSAGWLRLTGSLLITQHLNVTGNLTVTGAVVLGSNTSRATGANSLAGGIFVTAGGENSTALGSQSDAGGANSFAAGYSNNASGVASLAAGYNNSASGAYSIALGFNATASGANSTAIGTNVRASGDYALAMGNFSDAKYDFAVAIGQNATADQPHAVAIGHDTYAGGASSYALGFSTYAVGGAGSTAVGSGTRTESSGAFASGVQSGASGYASVAMGDRATASGSRSFALGLMMTVSGTQSGGLSIGNASGRTVSQANTLAIIGGRVGINTTAPVRALDVNDTFRIVPRSAAPSSGSLGDMYVDSDTNELCFYNSTVWFGLQGKTCA